MMIRKMIAATALTLGAAGAAALAPAAASAAPAALVFAGVYPSVPACVQAGAVGKSQGRWSYYQCVILTGNQGGLWVQ